MPACVTTNVVLSQQGKLHIPKWTAIEAKT